MSNTKKRKKPLWGVMMLMNDIRRCKGWHEPMKSYMRLLELENHHLRQEIDQYQAIISQLCTKCDLQRMVIQALTKGDKDNEKPA